LELIQGAYPGDRSGMVEQLELGLIDRALFERWLAAELSRDAPHPLQPQGLIEALFAEVRPETRMHRAVQRARELGIRTALVSNSWGSGHDQDAVASLFDVVVVSARVHMRKPEPAIYLFAAERLGVMPSACVFVDDLAANVDGARAVGMRGVLHVSTARTIATLERIFRAPLR
jgi:epoxide hydrolase-like predicted phosphatase